MDFQTFDSAPRCVTPLKIERQAQKVYTRTIFLLIQTEMHEGCWNCAIQDLKIEEGCETFMIRDKNPWVYRKLNKQLAKELEVDDETEAKKKFLDYKVCYLLLSMYNLWIHIKSHRIH